MTYEIRHLARILGAHGPAPLAERARRVIRDVARRVRTTRALKGDRPDREAGRVVLRAA